MSSSKTDVIVLGAGIVGVCGGAVFAGARPRRHDRRSPGRRGGRDQLRQLRHRAERGGVPLRVSARARRNRPRRAQSRSARANPLPRLALRSRRGYGAIFSPPRRKARLATAHGDARAGPALPSPSIVRSPEAGRRAARCCAKAAGSRCSAPRAARISRSPTSRRSSPTASSAPMAEPRAARRAGAAS